MRIILIISLITMLVSCDNAPTNSTSSLNQAFFTLHVTEDEFSKWNKGSVQGWPELMQGASKEFYKGMKDEFDFLFFVVDNQELPPNVPYGSQVQTKTNVDGLGLDTAYDVNSDYGSAGKLKSAVTLWKTNINEGPILHEMAHYWFNFALDTENPSHWSPRDGGLTGGVNPGIFQAAWNNFADVELYLMGLIPASEVTDHKATLDEIVAKHGERSPAFGQAQKDFRGAVILITTKSSLSDAQTNEFTEMIEWIEDDEPREQGINWARQTGGRGNLDLSGLDAFKK